MGFFRNTIATLGAVTMYGFRLLNKDTAIATTEARQPIVDRVVAPQSHNPIPAMGDIPFVWSLPTFLYLIMGEMLTDYDCLIILLQLSSPLITATSSFLGRKLFGIDLIQALAAVKNAAEKSTIRLVSGTAYPFKALIRKITCPRNTPLHAIDPATSARIASLRAQLATTDTAKEQAIATNATQQTLQTIREKDLRISLLTQSNRDSVSNATNAALEIARLVEEKRKLIVDLRKAIDPDGVYITNANIVWVVKRIKQRLTQLTKETDIKIEGFKTTVNLQNETIKSKDGQIAELSEANNSLEFRIDELEVELEESSESAKQREEDVKIRGDQYKEAAKILKKRALDAQAAQEAAENNVEGQLDELRASNHEGLLKANAETFAAQEKLNEARKVDSDQYAQMRRQVNELHNQRDQLYQEKKYAIKAGNDTANDLQAKLNTQEKELQAVQEAADRKLEDQTKLNVKLSQHLTKAKADIRNLRAKNDYEKSQGIQAQELARSQQSNFARIQEKLLQDETKQRGQLLTAEAKATRFETDFDRICVRFEASDLANEHLEKQLKASKRKQRHNKVAIDAQKVAEEPQKRPDHAATEAQSPENGNQLLVQELTKSVQELQKELKRVAAEAQRPDQAHQEQVKKLNNEISRLQQALNDATSSSEAQVWCEAEVQRRMEINQAELTAAAENEVEKRVGDMKATMDEQFDQQLQAQVKAKLDEILPSELQRSLDGQKAAMKEELEREVQAEKGRLNSIFQGALDLQLQAQKEKLDKQKKNAAIRDADEIAYLRKSTRASEAEVKTSRETVTELTNELEVAKDEAKDAKLEADNERKQAESNKAALLQAQSAHDHSDNGSMEGELERSKDLLNEFVVLGCCRDSRKPHEWVRTLNESNETLKQLEDDLRKNAKLTLKQLKHAVEHAQLDEAAYDEEVDERQRPELLKQLEQVCATCVRLDNVLDEGFDKGVRDRALLDILTGPRLTDVEWKAQDMAEAAEQDRLQDQAAASSCSTYPPMKPFNANFPDRQLLPMKAPSSKVRGGSGFPAAPGHNDMAPMPGSDNSTIPVDPLLSTFPPTSTPQPAFSAGPSGVNQGNMPVTPFPVDLGFGGSFGDSHQGTPTVPPSNVPAARRPLRRPIGGLSMAHKRDRVFFQPPAGQPGPLGQPTPGGQATPGSQPTGGQPSGADEPGAWGGEQDFEDTLRRLNSESASNMRRKLSVLTNFIDPDSQGSEQVEEEEELCKSEHSIKEAQQLSQLEKLVRRREEKAAVMVEAEGPDDAVGIDRDSLDRFLHDAGESVSETGGDESDIEDEVEWEDALAKNDFQEGLAGGGEKDLEINLHNHINPNHNRPVRRPRGVAERFRARQQDTAAQRNHSADPGQAFGETRRLVNESAIANLGYTESQAQQPAPENPSTEEAWSNLGELLARLQKNKQGGDPAPQGDQPREEDQ